MPRAVWTGTISFGLVMRRDPLAPAALRRQDASVGNPATQYAKTADGVHIAFASMGDGPHLIFIPGSVSNVELLWEDAGCIAVLRTTRSLCPGHHP